MKKLYALLLTLCLLCGSIILPASALAEATDELASNYIAPEIQAKLREKISYDEALRVYNMGHYFYDIAEGATIHDVIAKCEAPAEYVAFNAESDWKREAERFTMRNDRLSQSDPSVLETQLKQQFYQWLREISTASFLDIEGEGQKEIVNIYCLMSYNQYVIDVVVYDVGDAKYYAVYDKGMEEEALFFAEADFLEYVKTWVAAQPKISEDTYGGEGVRQIDVSPFNPLEVTLRKTAAPIWLLPVGIVLGVVALGGATAFVIVRKRKKKAVQEE